MIPSPLKSLTTPIASQPNVSVIIVCYNEEENIASCLESVVSQNYPHENLDVLVIDGDSNDNTIEIAQEFERKYKFIRVIIEPKKGTAAARNTGIIQTPYELIVFLDADCKAPTDWLQILVTAYQEAKKEDPMIAVVGGPGFTPDNVTSFATAIKIGLNTYLGSGGRVSGKYYSTPRYVCDLPSLNIICEKKLFHQLGFFNESLKREGEDAEFSFRTLQAGYKLFYHPDPFVFHKYRPTPFSWWTNMIRYGRARATLLAWYPSMLINVIYILPVLLVIALLSSFLALKHSLFLLPLLYFPMVLLISSIAGMKDQRLLLIPEIFLSIIITHIAYGLGMLLGFWRQITGKGPRKL